MKLKIFILSLFLIFSCKDDDTEIPVNIDNMVDIYVLNSNKEDLLNPHFNQSINTDEIKIFYMINGLEYEYNKPNLDNPRGFAIVKPENGYNKYRLQLSLNIESNDLETKTIIQWSEKERDTIKSNMLRKGASVICTKLWLNNTIVWNNEGNRFFEINK